MANVLTDIAVWSEAAEAAWFDRWANPDYEPGSEPGLTCTDMVIQRLELFGTPYREPLIPRHEPAPAIHLDSDAVSLSRLKWQHFAADLPPLPPSEPGVRDKMFRRLFQSQLEAFQAE